MLFAFILDEGIQPLMIEAVFFYTLEGKGT